MNGSDVAILAAKLDGLADLINEKLKAADERAEARFKSVEQKVESLIPKVVTTEVCQFRHSETATEVKKIIPIVAGHETRMVKVERSLWALAFVSGGLSTVAISALTWLVIQVLSGNLL